METWLICASVSAAGAAAVFTVGVCLTVCCVETVQCFSLSLCFQLIESVFSAADLPWRLVLAQTHCSRTNENTPRHLPSRDIPSPSPCSLTLVFSFLFLLALKKTFFLFFYVFSFITQHCFFRNFFFLVFPHLLCISSTHYFLPPASPHPK